MYSNLAVIIDTRSASLYLHGQRDPNAGRRLPIASVFALVLKWVSEIWKESAQSRAPNTVGKCHRGVCLYYRTRKPHDSNTDAWLVIRTFLRLLNHSGDNDSHMTTWGYKYYDQVPRPDAWVAAVNFDGDPRELPQSDYDETKQPEVLTMASNATVSLVNDTFGDSRRMEVEVDILVQTKDHPGPKTLAMLWMSMMSGQIWGQDQDSTLNSAGLSEGAEYVGPEIDSAILSYKLTRMAFKSKSVRFNMLENGLIQIWDRFVQDAFRGVIKGSIGFAGAGRQLHTFASFDVKEVNPLGATTNKTQAEVSMGFNYLNASTAVEDY